MCSGLGGDPVRSAYSAALAMLARRELSEAQVRERLARRDHERPAIDEAVAKLSGLEDLPCDSCGLAKGIELLDGEKASPAARAGPLAADAGAAGLDANEAPLWASLGDETARPGAPRRLGADVELERRDRGAGAPDEPDAGRFA